MTMKKLSLYLGAVLSQLEILGITSLTGATKCLCSTAAYHQVQQILLLRFMLLGFAKAGCAQTVSKAADFIFFFFTHICTGKIWSEFCLLKFCSHGNYTGYLRQKKKERKMESEK